MSNRHLPAGPSIPPAQGGPGGAIGVPHGALDMSGGPAPVVGPMSVHAHGHGPGPGPRRRQGPPHPPPPHHQYPPQYHQHMQPPMYPNYIHYGAPQQYYGMPPQYPNGAMPSPGYMPYQQNYPRSPPAAMHQYSPMVGVTVPSSYPRPHPQSPALATPYQPPPASIPMPPHTPSSTHSSQMPPPPTPPTPQTVASVASLPTSQEPSQSPAAEKAPFRAPLPWLSRPDSPFPVRSSKLRTRRKLAMSDDVDVSLPMDRRKAADEANKTPTDAPQSPNSAQQQSTVPEKQSSKTSPDTPRSEQRPRSDTANSSTPVKASASAGRTSAHPAIPLVSLPKNASKPSAPEQTAPEPTNGDDDVKPAQETTENQSSSGVVESEESPPAPVSGPKPAPTSWANLFAKSSVATRASGASGDPADGALANGHNSAASGSLSSSLFTKSNASNAAEAIRDYQVGRGASIGYIEPRGLINTGNMCYMNSILQVLMFCVPFYDFLNQVSSRAAHSFKSETPLVDAMIMFMHEFKVLKSASSVEQLRRSLKPEDLEKYGEPFTPEFVYEAIRQLPRFASMRRGHQQDAEEFLGFLLQSLDDECTHVLGTSLTSMAQEANSEDGSTNDKSADPTGDWLEVGRKQRSAVTRSSGSNIITPITKIFGGLLRSEFRVPGCKDSITTEPYQPLQLDIGSPDVRNVVDALRGLTRPERMEGDFNSPRGKNVVATKQVFIETLPPVLILHLKRFQFDAEGHGTIKIWKKIDYPLELEIPREAVSRQTRQNASDGVMPKYKLISVVYHHGKNASGGHYTVDVRRPDGQDWLRFDDTVLRQVRSDDVAEKTLEDESKNTRKEPDSANAPGNRYSAMDEEAGDDDGWKQVTASAGNNKRWSSVVNGSGSGSKGKQTKENVKDNKVAYLLFYQRV